MYKRQGVDCGRLFESEFNELSKRLPKVRNTVESTATTITAENAIFPLIRLLLFPGAFLLSKETVSGVFVAYSLSTTI